MKLIGVLGGMSWESTALYYDLMNREVRRHLGGHHSARVLIHSVDFAEIEKLQHAGDWAGTADILGKAARGLAKAGAECLVIATNTMHLVADEISALSGIPLIHIADATGVALEASKVRHVSLLGTRFTMEQEFYKKRLIENYNLNVMTPPAEERDEIHRIIYNELCHGIVDRNSAARYSEIIENQKNAGAEAVILGCTEITMIVSQETTALPVFDTTALHAKAAVAYAL